MKHEKDKNYQNLIDEQPKKYRKVNFVNLSISSLGVFSLSLLDFIEMLNDWSLMKTVGSTMFGKSLIFVSGPRVMYFANVARNWINTPN